MGLIYEPAGRAREYSPLALNVYTGGCDHGCRYCYCRDTMRGNWSDVPRARNLAGLDREAARASRQVLLCLAGDPYCRHDEDAQATRMALLTLLNARCSVSLLTKGGLRARRDLNLLRRWPGGRCALGATLTFHSAALSAEWEPGAASPQERLTMLAEAHDAGVRTWASLEPVIYPGESLAILAAALPYLDSVRLGRWNHDPASEAIDWRSFAKVAVVMVRLAGKGLYVKAGLRAALPDGYCTPEESDMDAQNVPDRPADEAPDGRQGRLL